MPLKVATSRGIEEDKFSEHKKFTSTLEGEERMPKSTSERRLAHASCKDFGTWCRVKT